MRYTKTEMGQQAFKQRSSLLSTRQRACFILFDGINTADEVLASTAGLGATWDDVQYLVDQGLVLALGAPGAPPQPTPSDIATPVEALLPPTLSAQARYTVAKPLATQLTASLGLKGFRLNLAVESAAGCDDLLLLLPKIEAALGPDTCQELARALKD
ncbi:MAG: hypothetical protein WCK81_05195 [Betaproteobacteria bacterium]